MSHTKTPQITAWLLRLGAVAALALTPLAVTGCSDDGGGGGEGASCSTSADCKDGFLCRNQTCVAVQANNGGADAGDTDQDGASNNGNNGTVEPEDYFISYVMKDKTGDGASSLHAYSTADDTHTQISPDGQSCNQGCWLSKDMSYFVWAEASANGPAGTLDIYKAAVNDLSVESGGGELVVEGVRSPAVAGNVVTYQRESGGQYAAYYTSLDSGSETNVGVLGSGQTTIGGWFIDPESNTGLIFQPNIQSMALKFGSLDGAITDTSYTVNAENYQEISGGYFGASMPVAISPDGKIAAFVTEAPNDYGACESAADCSGPVKRCGRYGRCTAIEVTVHFVDLENLGDLGGACGGEGTCGDIHECYQPDEDTTTAKCIPGRVVMGMPIQPYQSPDPQSAKQDGCELTDGNADYRYTKVRGPITFDKAGNLYAVGTRDCADGQQVGDSDILRIDPESGEYEVVWGNPDTGYDPGLCWNNDEQKPDDSQCIPYIKSARLSPGGNELAFLATNPGVAEGRLAAETMDLWTVLRNGEQHGWVGGHNYALKHVQRLYVHPAP